MKKKIIKILTELDNIHIDGLAMPKYLESLADRIFKLVEEARQQAKDERDKEWEKHAEKAKEVGFELGYRKGVEEERETVRKKVAERSEIERKRGWHITDIEQCRQFIDDLFNLLKR